MNRRLRTFLAAHALACAFVLCGQAGASAQARSAPPISGQPSRVERAMGRTIDVAAGRPNRESSVVIPTTSSQPNRQQYEWAERARLRGINERNADKDLRDHPEMPVRLNTTADDLRKGYHEATFYNPLLTFDQYVVVTRLVADLGRTHPNITRVGLLNGITAGKSLERTLVDRGLDKEEAKAALRLAKREIKESRRRN